MHKLQAVDVESLMLPQQQCLHHRELSVTKDSVGENVTLGMLEAFMKKLDAVAAGWDPESCHWLKQDCVHKP